MAKKPKADQERDSAEMRPDSWDRFERAVDAAVKGGPKHRAAAVKKMKRSAASKTRKPKKDAK